MMADISPEAAELAHKVTPTGWHGTVIDEALKKAKVDGMEQLVRKFQLGGWADVKLQGTDSDPFALGAAQRIVEWLRAEAARLAE